jgi:[NiFe] hydrogenase assembly HybE family chaperone
MDVMGGQRPTPLASVSGAELEAAPQAALHTVIPAAASVAELSARVEQAYAHIEATRMQDVPFLNPALRVEAVGFRVWEGRYLGVLITPWFMNLMLLPQEPAAWRHVRYGDSIAYSLPAGVFEFISALDPQLSDYQSCSLFSPVFEFGDQDGARATAIASLEALFASETRAGAEGPGTSLAPLVDMESGAPLSTARLPTAKAPVSKRDFLRGRWHGDSADSADTSKPTG